MRRGGMAEVGRAVIATGAILWLLGAGTQVRRADAGAAAAVPFSTPIALPTSEAFRPGPCPVGEPSDLSAHGVSCGTLTVPERHERPDGPTIELPVAVLAPEDDSRRLDPVVYLTGGPGGSAMLELGFWAGSSVRHDHEVILLDQRGAGFARPSLACREVVVGPDERLTNEENRAAWVDAVGRCRDRLTAEGIDLTAYTTDQNAADVIALRRALGIERWSLYGISYGTRLALEVLRDDPAAVGSAVLDSVYPPDARPFEDEGARLDRALGVLVDACTADAACAAAYPGLGSGLAASVDALDQRVSFLPDAVPGHTIEAAIRGWLYDTRLVPLLPAMIHSAEVGNTAPFLSLLNPDVRLAESESLGMWLSVECSERSAAADPTVTAGDVAAHPRWRSLLERDTDLARCATWSVPPVAADARAPVHSSVAVLLFAGQLDPVTPPSYAAAAAATLPRARIVEVPGFGHAVTLDPCPAAIRDAFLVDAGAALATSCITGRTPARGGFVVDQVANAGLGRLYHRFLFALNGPTVGQLLLLGFAGTVAVATLAGFVGGLLGGALARSRGRTGSLGSHAPDPWVRAGRRLGLAVIALDTAFVVGLAVVIAGQPDALVRDLGLPVGALWILSAARAGAVLSAALVAVTLAVLLARRGPRRARAHLAVLSVAALIATGTLIHYGVI